MKRVTIPAVNENVIDDYPVRAEGKRKWRPEGRPHDMAFWRYVGEAARASYMPAPGSEMTA